jgi:transposase
VIRAVSFAERQNRYDRPARQDDVTPVDVQDRDAAPDLLACLRSAFPWLRHIFADGGYAGPKLQEASDNLGNWRLEIVKRSDAAKGFVLLPRRWIVERTCDGLAGVDYHVLAVPKGGRHCKVTGSLDTAGETEALLANEDNGRDRLLASA